MGPFFWVDGRGQTLAGFWGGPGQLARANFFLRKKLQRLWGQLVFFWAGPSQPSSWAGEKI